MVTEAFGSLLVVASLYLHRFVVDGWLRRYSMLLVKLAVGAACLVAGPCGLSALLLVWRAAVGMARCWWYGALLVLALKHLLQDAVRAVYCWCCHLGLLC